MTENGVSFSLLTGETFLNWTLRNNSTMNKALHVFVYLFLIGVGVALWYEFQLNDKRSELRDRNRLLEDYIVKQIAPQVELGDKYAPIPLPQENEIEIDVDDAFDPNVTIPKKEEIVAGIRAYNAIYENTANERLAWGNAETDALRDAFIIDPATGKPMMDGANRRTSESTADKKLKELVDRMSAQNEQLRKTREVIPALREKLAEVVRQYNELTPHLRAYIQTNNNQIVEIDELNTKNGELEAEKVKLQDDVKDLRQTIEGLKLDLDTAKEETDLVREDLDKQVKMVEALKKQIQTLLAQRKDVSKSSGGGDAITTLPFGDKGKVLVANNEFMFAVVEFTPEAMKELKGEKLENPLPILELMIKREGFEGPAGEFIGRIRIRQEVSGKNYVLCDILTNWSQDDLKPGDTVFAPKD